VGFRALTELDVDGGEGEEAGHEHLWQRLAIPGQGWDLARVLGGAAGSIELGLEPATGADVRMGRLVSDAAQQAQAGLASWPACAAPAGVGARAFVFLPMMPPTTVSGKVTSAQMTTMMTMVPKGSAAVVPYTQATVLR
jgi:hypothetical protein